MSMNSNIFSHLLRFSEKAYIDIRSMTIVLNFTVFMYAAYRFYRHYQDDLNILLLLEAKIIISLQS